MGSILKFLLIILVCVIAISYVCSAVSGVVLACIDIYRSRHDKRIDYFEKLESIETDEGTGDDNA